MANTHDRKNILITGGAGFIGSHLCERLVKTSNVICVDNFSSGNEENIDHLLRLPSFEFIRHDLTKPIDLENMPELRQFDIRFSGIDEIYHCACPSSHKDPVKYSVETALANSHATFHSLEIAVKHHSKFLFASTASVYGDPLAGQEMFEERYWGFLDPLGPRAPYNIGKRFGEILTKAVSERNGLDYKITRIFNTYGPRMIRSDGRKIPDMIEAAAADRDISIYGDGNDDNTYCYIDDLVDGLLKLMETKVTSPINIGNPKKYSDKDIAEKIIRMMKSKSKIVYHDPLPFISRPARPDIQLAQKFLNWFPIIDFEPGLLKTIEYHLGNRGVIDYQKP